MSREADRRNEVQRVIKIQKKNKRNRSWGTGAPFRSVVTHIRREHAMTAISLVTGRIERRTGHGRRTDAASGQRTDGKKTTRKYCVTLPSRLNKTSAEKSVYFRSVRRRCLCASERCTRRATRCSCAPSLVRTACERPGERSGCAHARARTVRLRTRRRRAPASMITRRRTYETTTVRKPGRGQRAVSSAGGGWHRSGGGNTGRCGGGVRG